jgi:hypothetical protein
MFVAKKTANETIISVMIAIISLLQTRLNTSEFMERFPT